MKRHTRDKLTVVAGVVILLAIAAMFVLWEVVEITVAVTLFNIHEGFLGGCMAAIATINAVYMAYVLGREFAR